MNESSTTHPSFSLGRRLGTGLEVLVACVSVLAVVVMLNYLATRYYWRADLTAGKRWELTPRTLKVMEALPAEVKVVVYYSQNERLYHEVTDLLREYAARNPRLKLELVDPERNPAEANLVRTRYNLAALNQRNLILFDCNGKYKAVYQQDLADYELEAVPDSTDREFRRRHKSFRGEQMFTSALVQVINPRPLKAYFVQGHGEHDPASSDELTGYSKMAQLLRENGLEVAALTLFGTAEVPADCSLLIIAGTRNPFVDEELAKLDRYLNNGGRLMVLFNYRSFGRRVGLESLLSTWGVMVSERFALDRTLATPASRDRDLRLPITQSHAITRPLLLETAHFLLPRAVSAIKTGGRSLESLKVDELLHTSPEGVLVGEMRETMPVFSPRDPRSRYPVMAAVEKGAVPGVKAERGSTRIVVAGDSEFLANQMIESGANRDLGGHCVNWLVDQTFLLSGINPRPMNEYRLNLTQAQLMSIHALLLGALPGGVLFLGTLVWLRRRK